MAQPAGDDGFERYLGSSAMHGAEPEVGFRRNGTMGLNFAAFHELGEPTHLTLLFNRSTRAMAIEPAEEGEAGALKLASQSSRHFGYSAVGFFKAFDIPTDRARRYRVRRSGTRLVIDVDEPSDGGTN